MGMLRYRIEEMLKSEYREMDMSSDVNILYFDAEISRETAAKARRLIESHGRDSESLVVILTTDGGLMTEAEAIIMDWRNYYKTVEVAVPERAMSSGTMLALSADRLYMRNSACLGPVDTQTMQPDGSLTTTASYARYMEALLISKDLTPSEKAILDKADWGRVQSERKAENLPRSILKRTMNTRILDNSHTVGEIAFDLTNELKWYSHDRQIRKDRLKAELGIVAADYKLDAKPWGVRVDSIHEMEQEYKAFMKAKGVLLFYGADDGGFGSGREFLFGEERETEKA
jgi:hypothetical protein